MLKYSSEDLIEFLRESLSIEGIFRLPTKEELVATDNFLHLFDVTIFDLLNLQVVYTPNKPLRDKIGMDVTVGKHRPMHGGFAIRSELLQLCRFVRVKSPWHIHVEFEKLHPFMDGNGRTGRTLWAWSMLHFNKDPFELPFLHKFYYQTLEVNDYVR